MTRTRKTTETYLLVLLVLGDEILHVRLGFSESAGGGRVSGRPKGRRKRRTHSISSMPSPVYQWRKALRRTAATVA
jgi:hypothetical protein